MENDFESVLLTLEDDDGQLHEFELIDELELDEGHFVALVPTLQNPSDSADAQSYVILEALEEDGETAYQEVEDDALLRRLANQFEDRFNEFFYGDEEPEE